MESVLVKDLLACPFCGGEAAPVCVLPSVDENIQGQSFWLDRSKVKACEYVGCMTCGVSLVAIIWQKRLAKKGA